MRAVAYRFRSEARRGGARGWHSRLLVGAVAGTSLVLFARIATHRLGLRPVRRTQHAFDVGLVVSCRDAERVGDRAAGAAVAALPAVADATTISSLPAFDRDTRRPLDPARRLRPVLLGSGRGRDDVRRIGSIRPEHQPGPASSRAARPPPMRPTRSSSRRRPRSACTSVPGVSCGSGCSAAPTVATIRRSGDPHSGFASSACKLSPERFDRRRATTSSGWSSRPRSSRRAGVVPDRRRLPRRAAPARSVGGDVARAGRAAGYEVEVVVSQAETASSGRARSGRTRCRSRSSRR